MPGPQLNGAGAALRETADRPVAARGEHVEVPADPVRHVDRQVGSRRPKTGIDAHRVWIRRGRAGRPRRRSAQGPVPPRESVEVPLELRRHRELLGAPRLAGHQHEHRESRRPGHEGRGRQVDQGVAGPEPGDRGRDDHRADASRAAKPRGGRHDEARLPADAKPVAVDGRVIGANSPSATTALRLANSPTAMLVPTAPATTTTGIAAAARAARHRRARPVAGTTRPATATAAAAPVPPNQASTPSAVSSS